MILTKSQVDEMETFARERLNDPPENPAIRDVLRNQLSLVETVREAWQKGQHEQVSEDINAVTESEKPMAMKQWLAFITLSLVLTGATLWFLFGWPAVVKQPLEPTDPTPYQPPYMLQNY